MKIRFPGDNTSKNNTYANTFVNKPPTFNESKLEI